MVLIKKFGLFHAIEEAERSKNDLLSVNKIGSGRIYITLSIKPLLLVLWSTRP
jgi:hypothetical protein